MDERGSPKGKSADDAAPERASLLAAMLAISGESGYRATTVEALLERSGVDQLSPHFASLNQCFAAAYEVESERLWRVLRQAAPTDSGLCQCLRATLTALFAYVIERPGPSRALLIEVRVAGGAALARHEQILGRLANAIENSACRQTSESRHSPPPLTAEFMVGAIEQSVCSYLLSEDPRRIWASLPELMHLVLAPYLGEQLAAEELQRAYDPSR